MFQKINQFQYNRNITQPKHIVILFQSKTQRLTSSKKVDPKFLQVDLLAFVQTELQKNITKPKLLLISFSDFFTPALHNIITIERGDTLQDRNSIINKQNNTHKSIIKLYFNLLMILQRVVADLHMTRDNYIYTLKKTIKQRRT